MKNTFFAVLLGFITLLSTSCVHYYYAPSSNNVPLFKEKGEARLQAQYTAVAVDAASDDDIGGFELQAAYAAGKHLGLQLNFMHAGYGDPDYGSGNGNYIEAAAGYFKPLKNNKWIFETYGGIGRGSVKSIYKNGFAKQDAATYFNKFFVQPSFGYSRKHFSFALSSKISMVGFGVSSSSLTDEQFPDDHGYVESFKKSKTYIWLEPGYLIRGGFENFQVFIQATYSIQGDHNMPFSDGSYSLGIVFPFKIKSK